MPHINAQIHWLLYSYFGNMRTTGFLLIFSMLAILFTGAWSLVLPRQRKSDIEILEDEFNESGSGVEVEEDDDATTTSMEILTLMTEKTISAFMAFNQDMLGCDIDCMINPSTLTLMSLPYCQHITNISLEMMVRNLQKSYDDMMVYQHYLNTYNTTLPKETQQNLDVLSSLFPSFEIMFPIDVYDRSCEKIEVNYPSRNPVVPMYSSTLETARSYLYLQQFSEFLACFKFTYYVFWTEYAIMSPCV